MLLGTVCGIENAPNTINNNSQESVPIVGTKNTLLKPVTQNAQREPANVFFIFSFTTSRENRQGI